MSLENDFKNIKFKIKSVRLENVILCQVETSRMSYLGLLHHPFCRKDLNNKFLNEK